MIERRTAQVGVSVGHGAKIERQQESAIAALLKHPTLEQAAASCGLANSTLRRWMQQPAFRRHYRDARQRIVDQTIHDLQGASATAVKALREIVANAKTPPAARVAAARVILDGNFRGFELRELAERMADLENSFGTGEDHEH